MGSKSPIFPIPEPQHYSDYGFDPQLGYFQVLEEARRHGKRSEARPIDTLHFRLQKPISKDEHHHRSKTKKRKWWWKSAALLFWKRNKPTSEHTTSYAHCHSENAYLHHPVSGPLYVTESTSGSATHRRPGSGPLRFTDSGESAIPYLSLRDLNLMEGHRVSASNPAAVPIYLVT